MNILDFMMVMPLGPDFAKALAIPESQLGYIGGAYTLAAALSGIVSSFFLDRFDRRPVLALSMLGLVVGTAAGGLAVGLPSLVAARFLAGAFGGPAAATALAIVADVVPPARRGRAMGSVMTGFAVASTLGVPIGLKLAEWGDWRLPFFAVAALGLLVNAGAALHLPSLRAHLGTRSREAEASPLELVSRPVVALSLVACACVMFSGFVIIPNMSPYLQENLGYPRENLALLYLVGGLMSFVVLPLMGRLVDRFGSFVTATVGSICLATTVAVGFYRYVPGLPVLAVFVGFMTSMSIRNVPFQTLTTKVPGPLERASYMSILSAVRHLSSALAAMISPLILSVRPDGKLEGVPTLAILSLVTAALVPPLVYFVEKKVHAADARAAALELAID